MNRKVYSLFTQAGRSFKSDKNLKVDVYSLIMYLAPADRSGYEVCPMRSAGCTAACLNTAGFSYKNKDGTDKKEAARIARTKLYFEDRPAFMRQLVNEIDHVKKRAKHFGMQCGIRLNGTSDIPWENVPVYGFKNVMELFPEVAFMDYTKRHNRRGLPENYRLTFSRSEKNDAACAEAVKNGMNTAIVFRRQLPKTWMVGDRMLKVIDGDIHDWRYGDYDAYPNERVIVGLRAKGLKGRNDRSGFVLDYVQHRQMEAA